MRYKGEKRYRRIPDPPKAVAFFEMVQPGAYLAGDGTLPAGSSVLGPLPICWEFWSHGVRRRTYGLGNTCGHTVLNAAQIPNLNYYASN
ncbi:uncharacterized [Tachysurus ichikawai]